MFDGDDEDGLRGDDLPVRTHTTHRKIFASSACYLLFPPHRNSPLLLISERSSSRGVSSTMRAPRVTRTGRV
jgi:hypothetical protein